jgi:putative phage-type endonuclease
VAKIDTQEKTTEGIKMKLQIITPDSHEHWLSLRKPNLNSTEISALFDCNPYLSKFELWHQKKTQDFAPFEETERMMWGGLLEPVIAKRAAKELNRLEVPMKDYYFIPELRIGSSFDFYTTNLDGDKDIKHLMEIKNVDSLIYRKNWIEEDGKIEAPPHIEIQVQAQMLVSGIDTCDLCIMVGGNQLKITERKANKAMQDRILEECASFWKSIDENKMPEVDYNRDSTFLIDLYGTAEDDKVLAVEDSDSRDLIKEQVIAYQTAKTKIKELELSADIAKAKILEMIGDASKVTSEDFTISCGNVDPTEVKAFVKKGFRNFRITAKKKKDEN